MRHVSTRGEAAGLSFADVMLAGLARDGGLYVPEAWPRLDRETIAGFAGRPIGMRRARPSMPCARPLRLSGLLVPKYRRGYLCAQTPLGDEFADR